MSKLNVLFIFLISLSLGACSLRPPSVEPTTEDFLQALPVTNPSMNQTQADTKSAPNTSVTTATIETNLGDIKIAFYPEPTKTVDNFLKLSREGFYKGVTFHRVISGFMIQTGDPLSKDDDWSNDGRGGPGYTFEDEFNNHLLVKGSVAMANAGPNTNGSQFFIVTAEATPWLDGKHTNFGQVVEGMDVVDRINAVTTNEDDHPLEDITIKNIFIE